MSAQPFDVLGTEVSVQQLLALKTLAIDLARLRPRPVTARKLGDQRSKFRGQGREFIEMKHYQTGDDVRQIDWRQTAKKQTPFVRVMEEDRRSEHIIWLPLQSQQYFGTKKCFKSVLACHWAAFLCWRFVQLKHPVRLILQRTDGAWEDLKLTTTHHAANACSRIAQAHQWLAQNFRQPVQRNQTAMPVWRGSPTVWLISDFVGAWSNEIMQHCQNLPSQAVHCLQTLDGFDRKLPSAGELPVRQNNAFGVIQSQRKTTQTKYAENFQQHQKSLEMFCWQHNGQFLSYDIDKFSWQEVRQWPLYH